ncbi:MAG: hypothetical protein ABIG34_02180 [Candidatus Peregrinibacteria bacterium]
MIVSVILSRLSIALALSVLIVVALPVPVSAERWDYLFENLSWTPAETDGEGGERSLSVGSFAEAGQDRGFSNSGFWGYLFSDLAWPEESFSVGGLGAGE